MSTSRAKRHGARPTAVAREGAMSKLCVQGFTVSTDGYGAGPHQSLEHPLGVGGEGLHAWLLPTRTFRTMHGGEGGSTGIDDDFARRGSENLGAWILGRNMFGPIRGPWKDESWKGWWGENPPYHVPVFVLTHHPRDPVVMQGGTTFHFVTEGIEAALRAAREAAGPRNVRLGGGVDTIRQYLRAGLVDEMHLVVSPIVLGSGESLFVGLSLPELGFRVTEHVGSEAALHVVLERSSASKLTDPTRGGGST